MVSSSSSRPVHGDPESKGVTENRCLPITLALA